MSFLIRLRGLWRTLFRKQHLDDELDRELGSALDTYAARYAAAGLDAGAAKRAAALAFGGVTQVKEAIRDHRTGAALDAFLIDLRYAIRSLRRTPVLTSVI